MISKDQFMLYFAGFFVLAFFISGVFDVMGNFIVKLILFSAFSFIVANIYYVLLRTDNKKSHEKDSE